VSNLQPTVIVDKNGKTTTVHKKIDTGAAAARASAAPATPSRKSEQAQYDGALLPIEISEAEVDAAVKSFLEVAIFTSTHSEYNEETGEESEPVELDSLGKSVSDFSTDSNHKAHRKICEFIENNPELVEEALEIDDYSADDFGGDLYYTMHGHGTGFWDREPLKANGLGDRLTAAADEAGTMEVFLGNNGELDFM
jgi:hypothetical protein